MDSAQLTGDGGLVALAQVLQAMIEAVTSSADAGQMEAAVAQARMAAEQLGSGPVCARLWMLVGAQEGYFFSRHEDAARASGLACSLALETGEAWLEATARWHLALHIVRGPGEIEELLRRGQELIQGLGGAAEANFHGDASTLYVALGDPDAARVSLERALTIGREFWPIDEFYGPWTRGCLLLDLEQPDESLPLLRTALDGARALDAAEAGTILVDIARALLVGGDSREALAAIERAQTLSEASGDLLEGARWCGARSRALAATGQLDDALALVDDLVRLADTSQAPDATYIALTDAATVLATAADYDGARRLYEQALRESEARAAHEFARRAAEGLARVDDSVARSAAGNH